MIRALVLVILCGMCGSVFAEDPRLAKDGVRECVEVAKSFMKSREYSGRESEQDLVRACSGRGMGKWLHEQKATVASYDRREIPQIKALLKECE